VNTAMVELDKITQSNAASAEEGASAATQLDAQIRELTKRTASNLVLPSAPRSQRVPRQLSRGDRIQAVRPNPSQATAKPLVIPMKVISKIFNWANPYQRRRKNRCWHFHPIGCYSFDGTSAFREFGRVEKC